MQAVGTIGRLTVDSSVAWDTVTTVDAYPIAKAFTPPFVSAVVNGQTAVGARDVYFDIWICAYRAIKSVIT